MRAREDEVRFCQMPAPDVARLWSHPCFSTASAPSALLGRCTAADGASALDAVTAAFGRLCCNSLRRPARAIVAEFDAGARLLGFGHVLQRLPLRDLVEQPAARHRLRRGVCRRLDRRRLLALGDLVEQADRRPALRHGGDGRRLPAARPAPAVVLPVVVQCCGSGGGSSSASGSVPPQAHRRLDRLLRLGPRALHRLGDGGVLLGREGADIANQRVFVAALATKTRAASR